MFKQRNLFVFVLLSITQLDDITAFPGDDNQTEQHTVTLENADKPTTSEQQDPMFQGMGGSYGQFGGMNGAFGPQENSVNFDFQCKCKAKSNLPTNLQAPTDANAAAQQQITQLQDQIRRLQEQIRRSQAGQSTFEQFAHILSMADGLDCNCSGASAPFNNFPFGGNQNGNSNQMGMSGGFGQQFPFMGGRAGIMGGPMMSGQRIFPGPMFP